MRRLAGLLLIAQLGGPVLAERLPFTEAFDLPEVNYDPAIPLPEHVIGHQVGAWHTRPDLIVAYFDAVGAASDRVQVLRHGSTYGGRPLIHAVVTSPANHARLEEIRQANLRIAASPDQARDGDLARRPLVVWLGYSVHGNEASASEASMVTLYHLAAGRGTSVEEVLDRCVILLVPMLNPDGTSRFVEWANAGRSRIPVDDPQHREHNEPWPGGRTNHYWFDMNRDWLPARLRESQGRLDLYHSWKPQLLTDHHEMGSEATFFFQPGVPSRNNPNTPETTQQLTAEIGQFHARRLDSIGSLYYSRESFDDFYYGKGSTYPDINGAVGILFEQASARAVVRETRTGPLTLGFTVRNQVAVSLSTLEAAVALRPRLLEHHRDFFRDALAEAAEAGHRGWVFPLDGRGVQVRQLLDTLLRHRIEVRELARPLTLDGQRYEPGSAFMVPARQAQYRLVKTLMENVTEFGDSVFYDVSTWSLPPAFGLSGVVVPAEASDPAGAPITAVPTAAGRVRGPEKAYAYLLDWRQDRAPEALFELMAQNVQARVLTRPAQFPVDGSPREFPRGTVILTAAGGEDAAEVLRHLMVAVVDRHQVELVAVSSGASVSGPDLGSPSAAVLTRPRIALIAGEGVRSSEVGEAWFELGERRGLPVSLIPPERLGTLGLDRYSVLVLVSGTHARIGDAGVNALRAWVSAGGRLIAISGGARWAIEKGLVEEKLRERPQNSPSVPYEDVAAARQAMTIPGSIFRTRLDLSHPLAFGLPETVGVFRDHQLLLEPSGVAGSTVARYTDEPRVSGYVPEDLSRLLPGSASLVARRQGRGAVVLFADNPNFRAFWPVTGKMFLNAIFFSGLL